MECTLKTQTTQQVETTEIFENRKITRIKQNDSIDEESRKHRKYLAEQEALRQLERIKTHTFALFMR